MMQKVEEKEEVTASPPSNLGKRRDVVRPLRALNSITIGSGRSSLRRSEV